jgi:sugar phosphate isomerase/epimerase
VLGIENIEVERSEVVLEFLERLHHPWVRMTYDFGHNFLAGSLFGYDHMAAARVCAPYVAHLHVTDNFGRFNPARLGDFNLYQAIPHSNVEILGIGDLHLPLGWGTLPAHDAFAAVTSQGFRGLLISEHDYYHYDGADAEVLQAMRALAALVTTEITP